MIHLIKQMENYKQRIVAKYSNLQYIVIISKILIQYIV